MRVSNEGHQPEGAVAEWLRLQAEFQTVLATETMRYLTRLQSATQAAPGGTVVVPAPESAITVSATPGQTVRLPVEVENRQEIHTTVTPALSVLGSPSGTTWFPEATAEPPSGLVGPGQVAPFAVSVVVPTALPPGDYCGVVVLHGFRDDGIPVTVHVAEPATQGEGEADDREHGDDGGGGASEGGSARGSDGD